MVINKYSEHSWTFFNTFLLSIKLYYIFFISIKQGKGLSLLISSIYKTCILKMLGKYRIIEDLSDSKRSIKVALIGQSSVGKTTFLNTLLGYQNYLVDNSYFTTTDPTSITYLFNNTRFLFMDTAGITSNVQRSFENIFIYFSKQTIKKCDIIIFITDIYKILSKEDKKIINLINQNFKPYIIIINKIDLLINKSNFLKFFYLKRIKNIYKTPSFISAKNKNDVVPIILKITNMFRNNQDTNATYLLNKTLLSITQKFFHPLIEKKQFRIYFGKIVSYKPRSFLIYTNVFQYQIKGTYKRYIEKSIKRNFNIKEQSIKLVFLKKINK